MNLTLPVEQYTNSVTLHKLTYIEHTYAAHDMASLGLITVLEKNNYSGTSTQDMFWYILYRKVDLSLNALV